MDKRFLALLLAATATVPAAYAHVDGGAYGTPKLYCEDFTGDQATHDYAPPASGVLIMLGIDGSTPASDGCAYGDLDVAWDGHQEFALGGAWLLACENACGAGGSGGGSLVCFGTYADHASFPDVWVFDHALGAAGAGVVFGVFVDTADNAPAGGEGGCGDFESDFGVICVSHCAVPFEPGLDGSYQVFVCGGSGGHVWTAGGAPGASTSAAREGSDAAPATCGGKGGRGVDWRKVVPWEAGTAFEIDGPLLNNGAGQVLERTERTLKLRWETQQMTLSWDMQFTDKGGGKVAVVITDRLGRNVANDPNGTVAAAGDGVEVTFRDAQGKPRTYSFVPRNEDEVQATMADPDVGMSGTYDMKRQ